MIILEINEDNYIEKRKEGLTELESKFKSVDVLNNPDLPKEVFEKELAELCKDPSVWAYAFLKDKEGNRLRVYNWQDIIINDKNRFIHVSAANQIGKSWAVIIKALHHALHTNNASVMIISKREDQAKGLLDEIKWMMRRSNFNVEFEEIIDEVKNRFEMHLKSPDGVGVSAIRVFPPTTAILSFPATLIIGDEVGFWEKQEDMDSEQYYYQCVEPRTNTTKNWKHPFFTMGQIIFITNPNGQQGLAWRNFNDNNFHNYIISWLGKPDNTIEEYNQKRTEMPTNIFESVYAARYSLASGGFITDEHIKRFEDYNIPLIIPTDSIFYLGGDFSGEDVKSKSSLVDSTVLFGVIAERNKDYPKLPIIKVCYYKEFPRKSKKLEAYKEIERLKEECRSKKTVFSKFGYDKVGVGDSAKNDLIGRGILTEIQIESLTYSLENKSEVYMNLQHLFQQNLIQGSKIPKLREQILGLVISKPDNSQHYKIHHKTSGTHDDYPDSLATVCYIARILRNPIVSVEFEANKKQEDVFENPKLMKKYRISCSNCDDYFDYYWTNPKELEDLSKILCDDCRIIKKEMIVR